MQNGHTNGWANGQGHEDVERGRCKMHVSSSRRAGTTDAATQTDSPAWQEQAAAYMSYLLPPPKQQSSAHGDVPQLQVWLLGVGASLVLLSLIQVAIHGPNPFHHHVAEWLKSSIPVQPTGRKVMGLLPGFKWRRPHCPEPLTPWQEPAPPFSHPNLGTCGNWQADYSKLHADILAGRAPQRYVVVGGVGGLADCLAGAMSAFYHALLTGRAFQMRMEFPAPQWEWGYEPRGVNWTVPQPNSFPMRASSDYDGSYPVYDHDTSTAYFRLTWWQPGEGSSMIRGGNVWELAKDFRTIYWEAGGGFMTAMFHNPHTAEKLAAMGLRPETAFGCAMQFLMQPTAEVRNMFAPEAAALADEETLKIGIQIRLGDDHLLSNDTATSMDHVDAWFECAETVEKTRRTHEGQRVFYYVISDSKLVRNMARQHFGADKVVTDTTRQLGHTIGHVYAGKPTNTTDAVRVSYITTVGENWLFGLTDVQVHSENSAFGKLAGLRGLRFNNQYFVGIGGDHRSCGIQDADPFLTLANSFSKV